MNKKQWLFPVLAWLLVATNEVWAQPYSVNPPATTGPQQSLMAQPVPVEQPSLVPSDWILYRKSPDCCGPIGGDGPLKTEFYLRSGWSFPTGGFYGDELEVGWAIQGGARLMVFNPVGDSAWTLDISGSNIWNQARASDLRVPLSILLPNPVGIVERVELGQGDLPGVTLRDLNRTFVNVGIGKMWYLNGPPSCGSWNWRIGIEGGGRYGSASAQFFEIRARNDRIGGAFVGLHTDVDIPCGCCLFHGGVRGEYSYTWSDILQRPSDVGEVLLLFEVGVRY